MELHEGLAEVRRGKKESDKALEVILLMRLGVRQERSGDGDGGRGERLCQESSECGDGVLSIERVFGGLRDTRTEKVELVEL